MTEKLQEQIQGAIDAMIVAGNKIHSLQARIELLEKVAEAAKIYRRSMTGEIKAVQACGMRLDEALAALKEKP